LEGGDCSIEKGPREAFIGRRRQLDGGHNWNKYGILQFAGNWFSHCGQSFLKTKPFQTSSVMNGYITSLKFS
jgi:hypothetical protein